MQHAMSISQLSTICLPQHKPMDTTYGMILIYLIGVYVGMLITTETKSPPTKLKPINDIDLNKDEDDQDDEDYEDDDDEYQDYEDQDDEDQEHDEQEDEDQDDEDQENDGQDENELKAETVRSTIDIIYIYTDKWDDFVSKKSIYLRLQKLYPTITKFMVKEAMNIEPRYITGSQHNTGGYRYISEL
jgi:hypothetical protein